MEGEIHCVVQQYRPRYLRLYIYILNFPTLTTQAATIHHTRHSRRATREAYSLHKRNILVKIIFWNISHFALKSHYPGKYLSLELIEQDWKISLHFEPKRLSSLLKVGLWRWRKFETVWWNILWMYGQSFQNTGLSFYVLKFSLEWLQATRFTLLDKCPPSTSGSLVSNSSGSSGTPYCCVRQHHTAFQVLTYIHASYTLLLERSPTHSPPR